MQDLVFKTMLEMLGGKFGFHTDDHSLGDPLVCAGCGHCKGAINKPEEYLQSGAAVKYVTEKLLPRLEELGIHPTVYTGSHREKGVIISRSVAIELNSVDRDSGEQVFTYNQAVHDLFLQKIVERLQEKGISIQLDKLLEKRDRRLQVTVDRLAKGLPIFVIS